LLSAESSPHKFVRDGFTGGGLIISTREVSIYKYIAGIWVLGRVGEK
jgi:hypothetical protein